jgi:ribosome-binding factor A
LQSAISRQARVRRVPELVFRPDPSVRSAERIEGILRELNVDGSDQPDDSDDGHSDEDA